MLTSAQGFSSSGLERSRQHALAATLSGWGRAEGAVTPVAAMVDGATISKLAWHSWRLRYVVGLLIVDLVGAFVAMTLCYVLRPGAATSSIEVFDTHLPYGALLLSAIPVWLLSLSVAGAYHGRHLGEGISDYRLPWVVGLQSMAVVAIASYALHMQVSRSLVLVYFPALLATALAGRFGLRLILAAARRQGVGLRRLLLAGNESTIRKVADHLASRNGGHGYEVVAVCAPLSAGTEIATRAGPLRCLGAPDDLVEVARELDVDAVAVVGDGSFTTSTLQRIAWDLESSHVELLVAPDVVDLAGPRIAVAPVVGLPLLHISEPRIGGRGRRWKVVYERLLGIPLLLLALPVMAVVALVIFVGSGRPILYRQERIGKRGETFSMLKFRTMVPGADSLREELAGENEHEGALFKIRNDPRITRVGRVLRKYSLDELPQLFNVLAGDMVLVGPRPCLAHETSEFDDAARRRFMAKPGLTGLWQVSGRSDLPWQEAVRLDLYYVENWSPLLDLLILFRTLRVVLRGLGC